MALYEAVIRLDVAHIDFGVGDLRAIIVGRSRIFLLGCGIDFVDNRHLANDGVLVLNLQDGQPAIVKRGALRDNVGVILLGAVNPSLNVDEAIEEGFIVGGNKVDLFPGRPKNISYLCFELTPCGGHDSNSKTRLSIAILHSDLSSFFKILFCPKRLQVCPVKTTPYLG